MFSAKASATNQMSAFRPRRQHPLARGAAAPVPHVVIEMEPSVHGDEASAGASGPRAIGATPSVPFNIGARNQLQNSATASGTPTNAPWVLNEIARVLFHTGEAYTAALGWPILIDQALSLTNTLLGPVAYWPAQAYYLYHNLINEREYLDSFLALLSLLPYNALSSDNFIFYLADVARQAFERIPLLATTYNLPAPFWVAVGLAALVGHAKLFAERNIRAPQTGLGRAATALFGQLPRIPQLYGLAQAIDSGTSPASTDETTTRPPSQETRASPEAHEQGRSADSQNPFLRLRSTVRSRTGPAAGLEQRLTRLPRSERAPASGRQRPAAPSAGAPAPAVTATAASEFNGVTPPGMEAMRAIANVPDLGLRPTSGRKLKSD